MELPLTGPCPPSYPLSWMAKGWGQADGIQWNLLCLPDLILPILACVWSPPAAESLTNCRLPGPHGRKVGTGRCVDAVGLINGQQEEKSDWALNLGLSDKQQELVAGSIHFLCRAWCWVGCKGRNSGKKKKKKNVFFSFFLNCFVEFPSEAILILKFFVRRIPISLIVIGLFQLFISTCVSFANVSFNKCVHEVVNLLT